ncbi:unnamed protein product [Calicophoron daubneyi]|uniref:C2H2-type domain-containing protein n=1 Tax=Calicophoron daubneyi TaxID=300641 RepID=A0AAV2TV56_CALDB
MCPGSIPYGTLMDTPLPARNNQTSSMSCQNVLVPIPSATAVGAESSNSNNSYPLLNYPAHFNVPQSSVPSQNLTVLQNTTEYMNALLNMSRISQMSLQQYLPCPVPSMINDGSQTLRVWDPATVYLFAASQFILRQLALQSQMMPPRFTYTPRSAILATTETTNVSPAPPLSTYPQSFEQRSIAPPDPNSLEHGSLPSLPTVVPRRRTAVIASGVREKPYRCTFPGCSKAYYKRSHLNEHSHLHTGLKPHICNQPGCGARFTRADQLSRHRRAHTGERNFFCKTCHKRFKRSDHLKVHLSRNVCTRTA